MSQLLGCRLTGRNAIVDKNRHYTQSRMVSEIACYQQLLPDCPLSLEANPTDPAKIDSSHLESNLDRGFYFHGLSLDEKGPVAPLLYGADRGVDQFLRAGDYFYIMDPSVFADRRLKQNVPSNTI